VTGEVQRDFGFLVECRNCFAHNNSEVLNQRNVTRLEGLCKRICEDIEKGNQNPDLPMGPEAAQEIQDSDAASAGPTTFYTKEDSIIREILESGKTYTLICEKTSRGTLRGPIKEINGFSASISAQNAAGIPYERGMELPVKLIDWDANPNGQKFNAEPV
jgi:hypothetical protein